jgi:8-oxo-dGTP diphosphatase
MKTQIQLVTVKGILQKEGRILLLKDTGEKWELPGGRIDFGDTPEQTLTREFEEELQVQNVQIGKLLHAWTFVVNREDSDRQYVVLVYTCSAPDQELHRSDEHLEIGWFPIGDIKDLPMREGYKEAISRLNQ